MGETPENLWLAEIWMEHRERLMRLLAVRMPAVLQSRCSLDDVAQETYMACGRRMSFLQEHPEVPVYVKLRRIALQTLVDLERRNLAAARGVNKEVDVAGAAFNNDDATMDAWARFADSISSPRTHLMRLERQSATRRILEELPQTDREILELRHFEDLSNSECAAVLGIEAKAASIRYVRALKRFKTLIENEIDI